jgi:prepilin-type N-terminal cleavage/methylation domain-containing protein
MMRRRRVASASSMSAEMGFTIVELLVVIAVSSIMLTIISAFALDYWGNTATLSSDQSTLVSRMNASDYLNGAIDQASGLISQNDLPDSHSGDPDPNNATGKYWLPIHAIPGLTSVGNPGTITPLIYFNRPSVNTSKAIILNGNTPYQDDIVLYMNGTTKQLLARTIANPNATNNRARTTCPPALATPSCPADTIIADTISGIQMRYFSRSGNTIDYTSIVDPNTGQYIGPDFPSVEIVEFTLNQFQKARLGNTLNTTNQTVVRVALRN